MILLDTDHVTVLRSPPSDRRNRLVARLALSGDAQGIPIVAVEEVMRGWLAAVAKERNARRQVFAYRELSKMLAFFAEFEVAPFDESAATLFDTYGRIRVSAKDRKIAAIAITQNALLLTANRQDFEQIPELRFENWMD